jgi:hypothetical protein
MFKIANPINAIDKGENITECKEYITVLPITLKLLKIDTEK